MPARQPFTTLCQTLGQARRSTGWADLHTHTTHSDGTYTPAQVVELARRSGLVAVAITDHDTIAGVAPAQAAAGGSLEVVPGVELTATYRGRTVHLLGYFFRPADPGLTAALADLHQQRRDRFLEMVERLRGCGVELDAEVVQHRLEGVAPGRRHLAELLVDARRVRTIREAFFRYLGDHGRATVPCPGLPADEALAVLRGAGGVAAWAHPPYDCTRDDLHTLQALGLGAVEVVFPNCRPGFARQLRQWAAELHLAVAGGSDCHGPEPWRRGVGSFGVTVEELQRLRQQTT